METTNDKHIIERIRNGESECFGEVLKRYGASIFSLILRIVGNREDAEELTQDVFLKVFDSIESYRGDSSFSTWLYRIAYNRAVSQTRRRKYETPCGDDRIFGGIDSSEGEYNLVREDEYRALEAALKKLSAEESLLITMYYYQDKSVEELSYITGNSTTNVKVKLFRIRKKLHEKIEHDGRENI